MKKGLPLLNIIQFLASLNENLVRLLCAFFAISLEGQANAASIMTITGALFLTPFLLFSTLGGLLADKYRKSMIIQITRASELIAFILLFLGILINSVLFSYLMLFVLASISAIFSPSKYSVILEYVEKKRLVAANSLICAFTFVGIILGTGLASLLVEVNHMHFLLAGGFSIAIALINFLLSFFLPPTKPQFPKRDIDCFYIKEFFFSLMEMKRIPYLLTATIASAYFLFLGSFFQLNIIPFSIDSLGLSAEAGGYLFTVIAIGISLGTALTSTLLKGRPRLFVIPYSGLMISIITVLIAYTTFSLPLILFLLIILGFFGGLYVVPALSYILGSSPNATRGRNYSTANLLSFLFAVTAPGILYLLNVRFELRPVNAFLIMAVFNGLVMLIILQKLMGSEKPTF